MMVYNIYSHSILYFLHSPKFNFLEHRLIGKNPKITGSKKEESLFALFSLGIWQFQF